MSTDLLDGEIERVRSAHRDDTDEISRLLVLLADHALRQRGRVTGAGPVARMRCMLEMKVLDLVLLSRRAFGTQRIRSIDVFPELPGLRVLSGVFSPEFAIDSYLWAKHMCALGITAGKTVLEMGAGTGVISLYLRRYCSVTKITAADVNEAAVENLRLNRTHFGIDEEQFAVIHSDLFENVAPDSRYDFILWAVPWIGLDDPVMIQLVEQTRDFDTRSLLRSVVDPHWTNTKRFISEAKSHLNAGGSVLLITSNFYPNGLIVAHATSEGYDCEISPIAEKIDVVPRIGMVLDLYQVRLTVR